MCTNITIPKRTKEEPLISARTMDWFATCVEDNSAEWVVKFVPRGQSFPENRLPGEICWNNKYGFIGIGFKTVIIPVIYADGMNERGLSAAHLSLFSSVYPKSKPGTPMLYNSSLVAYILGNFQNVHEVKVALSKLTIINISDLLPGKELSTLLHYIVTDAEGNSLIIEFVDGEMKMYMNDIGVLTNDPTYDWQLTNNQFYQQLSVYNKTVNYRGQEVSKNGQLGIPGDVSPQARFVRAAFMRSTAFRPLNRKEAIGAARQIIQTLTVPIGTYYYADENLPEGAFDWTQWTVIRDHTNRCYYYSTDFNSTLYGIRLCKLDMDASTQKGIDLTRPQWYVDLTEELEPND